MAEVTFGEWLRRRRKAQGWTQAELALRISCSTSMVKKLETEQRRPSEQIVKQLAEAFDIAFDEREPFLSFARGDWKAAPSEIEDAPWRTSHPPEYVSSKRHNLPFHLSSFIGRDEEIADVIHLLESERLLTLIGPGGIGKTRLSIQVANELLDHYPDGVWVVELAPILDPLLVPRTVAKAIGLHDEPKRPVIDMLCDYLREKKMLLLFDNCEHMVAVCAGLADSILNTCPQICLLVTSREALGIIGETTYLVPPLKLPDLQNMSAIVQAEAVRLFVERASAVTQNFSIDNENVSVIAQICYHLDGIPLAIELAASKIRVLTARQIAQHLDDRFHLLTGGSRTALPRHQTLEAAIEWSYELLSTNEQILFCRLSIFADGWTLEAAEAVCGVETGLGKVRSEDVLHLLEQLINKSLILSEEVHGESRYRMLETMRQYANRELVETGENDALRDRHLEYFLRLTETAAPHLIRPEQLEWLDRLDADYENIRAALKWALSKDSAEFSMRLCAALGPFWYVRSYWLEGSKWLRDALSKPSQGQSEAEQTARVRALYHDAELASALDDYDRMTTSAALSLELAKMGSDRLDTAIAGYYVGYALKRHRDENQAALILQESLNEFRKLNASYWEAQAYHWYGSILGARGEITLFEFTSQNLSLARIAGERFTLAEGLIGYARVISNHADDAIKLIEEAHSLLEQVGSSYNMGYFLLAELEWLKGEHEKANKIYLEIEQRFGLLGEKKYAIKCNRSS